MEAEETMPTKMFFDLSEEKREKIIEVCITEFSQHDYENSSTNRIIQNAGISKGSLFKYFQSKEELYFYILDTVSMEFITDLRKDIAKLPLDLFERIIKYSELEFIWYILHPDKCKLIIAAFSKNDNALHQKIKDRYNFEELDIYYKTLENIDISTLKWDKQKTVDILKWFLLGFKKEFIFHIQSEDFSDIELIRRKYIKQLTDYMTILKFGLIKEKNED